LSGLPKRLLSELFEDAVAHKLREGEVLFRAERLIDVGDLKLVARRGSDVGRDGAPTSAPSIAEALSAILARSASASELVKDFAVAKWPRSSRQLRQLARFCERNPRGIGGEGTACEGQRRSRDHDKGFSDQGRAPGQFAARSVAPTPGIRRHHSVVAAGTWAREILVQRG